MLTFIISVLLYFLLYVNGENSDEFPLMSPRIINGKVTHITNYTHQARLDNKRGEFICGGSIIADRAILTAGHCVTDGGITVRLGADVSRRNGGNVVEVKSVVIHPEFNSKTMTHDVAVILLKNNITYNPKVGKIEMAMKNGNFPRRATVVGWGCTACMWFFPVWLCVFPTSKELRYGEVTLDKHIGHQFESNSNVKICPGDSGGPVIDKDGKLVGVISYMDVSFWKNRPNYFMSVPDHIAWINEVIGR